MKKTKRFTLMLLVTLCLAAGAAFAAGTQATEASAGGKLAEVGFHPSGFPIVDQQVTMEITVRRPGHFPTPYAEMKFLHKIEEMTNIKFEFTELPDAATTEKVNLMFASRDFPQVMWTANVSDRNLYEAGQGGDVWALNEYLEKYAPNWMKAFQEYPILRKTITFPDGNIYSLPYSRQITSDYGIRDIEAINVDWLEKVGMDMPTTTDEFYEVLKAFRSGIDNGTLPANGIPYYLRFHSTIGGEFPLYGYFGLYIYDSGYLSVDDGEVQFGATDPQVLDVLEYLNKLYSQDLIMEEAFTDSWNDYITKYRSVPPITGAWGSYFIQEPLEEFFDPLPPLKGPGVDKPLFRSQQVRIEKNKYTIFKNFEYPEVAVRLVDLWADDLYAMQLTYGPIGETMDDNGDGTYTARGVSAEYLQHIPANFMATYISKGISDRIIFTRELGARAKYYNEIYKPYTWAQERHFPRVIYTDAELEELSILQNEVRSFVRSTWADWVVNGGARDGWDDYTKQLDKLGLEKLMGIYQAALDRFNAD